MKSTSSSPRRYAGTGDVCAKPPAANGRPEPSAAPLPAVEERRTFASAPGPRRSTRRGRVAGERDMGHAVGDGPEALDGPTAAALAARVRRAQPVVVPSRRVQVTHAVPSSPAESVKERMRPATDAPRPGSAAPRRAVATSSPRPDSGPRPQASSAPPPGVAWISGVTPSCPSERAGPKAPPGARRAYRSTPPSRRTTAMVAAPQRGHARRRARARPDGRQGARARERPPARRHRVADGPGRALGPEDDELAAVGEGDLQVADVALSLRGGQRRSRRSRPP